MRYPSLLLAAALVLSACGPGATESSPTAASTTTSTVLNTLPPPSPTTTEISEATLPPTTDPAQPTIDPSDDRAQASGQLSIEDALLRDDAFPPPWEHQWRQLDQAGYGATPNQTTCPEFAAYESLFGRGGGHVAWWVDGGNANHYVFRMDPLERRAILSDLSAMLERCPSVKWLEGGAFTIEGSTYGDVLALRFDDQASGEVTWTLVASGGDLVSVLQMPLWAPTSSNGPVPEPSERELQRLATLMTDRLLTAGPVGPGQPPPTTVPSTAPQTTLVPPPPPATTEPPAPTGLGALLLTEDELPDGWRINDVGRYTGDSDDEAFGALCPPARSIETVDAGLAWEANFRTDGGEYGFQLIGDLGSAESAAAAAVEFAEVAACDLSDLLVDEVATWGGGAVEVDGADAGGLLSLEVEGEFGGRLDLIVVAIDSVVVVVSIESPLGGSPDTVIDITRRAAAKVVAGR